MIIAGVAVVIIVVLALSWDAIDGGEYVRDILRGPGAYTNDPGSASSPGTGEDPGAGSQAVSGEVGQTTGTPAEQPAVELPDISSWPAYQANHTQCIAQIRQEPDNAWRYLDLAMEYYWDGYLPESLVALHAAITLYPGFIEAHMQRAIIFMELNRQPEGLAEFEYCSVTADDFFTDLQIAEYLGAYGHRDQALAYYGKAAGRARLNAGNRLSLANSYYAVGYLDLARQEYQAVMDMSSPGEDVYEEAKQVYELHF